MPAYTLGFIAVSDCFGRPSAIFMIGFRAGLSRNDEDPDGKSNYQSIGVFVIARLAEAIAENAMFVASKPKQSYRSW